MLCLQLHAHAHPAYTEHYLSFEIMFLDIQRFPPTPERNIWIFGCEMRHYVSQLFTNFFTHSAFFFLLKNSLLHLEIKWMRAVGLNQNSEIVGRKTKTMS